MKYSANRASHFVLYNKYNKKSSFQWVFGSTVYSFICNIKISISELNFAIIVNA